MTSSIYNFSSFGVGNAPPPAYLQPPSYQGPSPHRSYQNLEALRLWGAPSDEGFIFDGSTPGLSSRHITNQSGDPFSLYYLVPTLVSSPSEAVSVKHHNPYSSVLPPSLWEIRRNLFTTMWRELYRKDVSEGELSGITIIFRWKKKL